MTRKSFRIAAGGAARRACRAPAGLGWGGGPLSRTACCCAPRPTRTISELGCLEARVCCSSIRSTVKMATTFLRNLFSQASPLLRRPLMPSSSSIVPQLSVRSFSSTPAQNATLNQVLRVRYVEAITNLPPQLSHRSTLTYMPPFLLCRPSPTGRPNPTQYPALLYHHHQPTSHLLPNTR